MKALFRCFALLVAVALLVPVQLASAKKRSYALGDRTLKQGDRGRDVRVLQQFLTRAGIDADVDGIFGSGTKRAVRDFERSQRRTVDGRVSPNDVTVLRDVVENGSAVAAAAATGGALPKNMPPPLPVAPAPLKLGPGMVATVGPDGLAVAPAIAPPQVQQIIDAGNRIATLPYVYGGGHGRWEDTGYDCSGSVSYALHGANLIAQALPSGSFVNWGDPGPGQWVSVYYNGGHAYMVVAGLRFDTSGRTKAGTRWQAEVRSARGYAVRHPPGL